MSSMLIFSGCPKVRSLYPLTPVFDQGPAHLAGLTPECYVLGTLQFTYESVQSFGENIAFLKSRDPDTEIDMFVIDLANHKKGFVKVKPSSDWGGQGLLGMELKSCVFDRMKLSKIITNESNGRSPNLQQNQEQSLDKQAVPQAPLQKVVTPPQPNQQRVKPPLDQQSPLREQPKKPQ